MDISNTVNHAHHAAFRYLNEALDYISYEHDPADEIRYFNFEKVVHKNGCYVTTFNPVKPFDRGQTDPYKVGDDIQIIEATQLNTLFKPTGLRVCNTEWSDTKRYNKNTTEDKSNLPNQKKLKSKLLKLQLLSRFDPTAVWKFKKKNFNALTTSKIYKLQVSDYDLRPKLLKWNASLREKKFTSCPVFHHLFVKPVDWKSSKISQDLLPENDKNSEFTKDKLIFESVKDSDFVNQTLSPNQKQAVKTCISTIHPLSVIHGPPGTGKTTVIIEIIKKLLDSGQKILVCAHSNQAVDNVLVRMFELYKNEPEKFPYFGEIDHEKSSEDIKKYKPYSHQVHRHNNVLDEFDRLNDNIHKNTNLVFCTLHAVCDFNIGNYKADVVIVDEAGQTLDVDAWGALLRGKRCILAGDHHQLPPVIMKQDSFKRFVTSGCKSLMERAIEGSNGGGVMLLNIQHRMNKEIMRWSNQVYYNNNIKSGDSVKNQMIKDETTGVALPPIVVFDTKGLEQKQSTSFINKSEAKAVADYMQFLIDYFGVKKHQVGIISAYESQNRLMAKNIRNQHLCFNPDISALDERKQKRKINLQKGVLSGPKISTVDGFQGSEMDVILVSLVRSNLDKNIGFLKDLRRLNVATTRARKHLVIFCNADTVSKNKEIGRLVRENMSYDDWFENLMKETEKRQADNLQAEIRKNNMEFNGHEISSSCLKVSSPKKSSPKIPNTKPVNITKSKSLPKSPKKSSSEKLEFINLKKSKNKQPNMQTCDNKPLIKASSKMKKYTSETLKIIGNKTVNQTEIEIDLKKNKTKKNKRNPLKEVTKSIDNIKLGQT